MAAEMMKTPLSVVIPISNYQIHADNIKSILESASLFGVEVILVLDNQPKQAFENLRQIIKHLKIEGRVIQEEFNNPGGSRNSGMQLASRRWIAFWDCDDFPLIDETIKLIKDAESANAKIAIGCYEVEYIQTRKVVIQEMNLRHPQIGIGLNPGIWRMIFNKETITDIEFPQLSMGEDQVFLQRVINRESKIIFRKHVVYRYRIGVISQLTDSPERRRDIVPAHKLAVSEYNPHGEMRKMAQTMLVRQELTILRYPGMTLREKILLGQSLLKKIGQQPEVIIALLLSRFHSLREKRVS